MHIRLSQLIAKHVTLCPITSYHTTGLKFERPCIEHVGVGLEHEHTDAPHFGDVDDLLDKKEGVST